MNQKRLTVSVPMADFGIGDVVYLRLKQEKAPGFVTAVTKRNTGQCYEVTWGDSRSETCHYAFELTREYEPAYE